MPANDDLAARLQGLNLSEVSEALYVIADNLGQSGLAEIANDLRPHGRYRGETDTESTNSLSTQRYRPNPGPAIPQDGHRRRYQPPRPDAEPSNRRPNYNPSLTTHRDRQLSKNTQGTISHSNNRSVIAPRRERSDVAPRRERSDVAPHRGRSDAASHRGRSDAVYRHDRSGIASRRDHLDTTSRGDHSDIASRSDRLDFTPRTDRLDTIPRRSRSEAGSRYDYSDVASLHDHQNVSSRHDRSDAISRQDRPNTHPNTNRLDPRVSSWRLHTAESDRAYSAESDNPAPPPTHPREASSRNVAQPSSNHQGVHVRTTSRPRNNEQTTERTPSPEPRYVIEDDFDLGDIYHLDEKYVRVSHVSCKRAIHRSPLGERGSGGRWYFVIVGREVGIYNEWKDVQPLVNRVPGNVQQRVDKERDAYIAFKRALMQGKVCVVR